MKHVQQASPRKLSVQVSVRKLSLFSAQVCLHKFLGQVSLRELSLQAFSTSCRCKFLWALRKPAAYLSASCPAQVVARTVLNQCRGNAAKKIAHRPQRSPQRVARKSRSSAALRILGSTTRGGRKLASIERLLRRGVVSSRVLSGKPPSVRPPEILLRRAVRAPRQCTHWFCPEFLHIDHADQCKRWVSCSQGMQHLSCKLCRASSLVQFAARVLSYNLLQGFSSTISCAC